MDENNSTTNSEWLIPQPDFDTLVHLLNDLRGIYVARQDWQEAIPVVRMLCKLQPAEPQHVRDLGLLYYRADSLRLAAHYLEEYISRAPAADDADTIRQGLSTDLENWARRN